MFFPHFNLSSGSLLVSWMFYIFITSKCVMEKQQVDPRVRHLVWLCTLLGVIYSEFLMHFIFLQSISFGMVAKRPSLRDELGERKALFSKGRVYFALVDISEPLGNYKDSQR